MLPPLTHCRSVVTIHDCIHLRFPQYLQKRGRCAYASAQMGAAARRSDRILTVSESVEARHPRIFQRAAREDRPSSTTASTRGSRRRRAEDRSARVEERYQLQGEFALYVGNVKPHKNVERLLDAFHLVRRSGLDHLKLVVIGDEISKYAALRRAVHRYNLHKYVRFLGFLPDETLAVVYRLASVFVFPSLYEGFGLPPLEAMACGTPVVTSNVSSLPEVTGDAALLVDPYSAEEIADGDAPRADRRRAAIRSQRAGARPGARVLMGAIGAARSPDLRRGRALMTRVALVHDWLPACAAASERSR